MVDGRADAPPAVNSGRLRGSLRSFLKAEPLLLLCVLLSTAFVIVRTLPLVLFRYQIDYGEGLILEGATRLRHAQPLYAKPFDFPIVLHVYGPLSYAAAALVLPGGEPSFPAGRLLVLSCAVALCFVLAWILHRWTCSWPVALSFGLMLSVLPAFRFWLYLLRADVIGLLFSALGIAWYVRKDKVWHGVCFFALAIFCKYTLVAAPIAVCVHLVLKRRTKQAIAFALALVCVCALAFFYLQVASGGWFAFHMFSTHPDRYSLEQFVGLGLLVSASAPVVTALALWYVVREFRNRIASFAPIYFVTSFLTALTAGKLGSTTNHFLEWMVASCMCAGLGYSELAAKHWKVVPATVLLSASVVAAVIIQDRRDVQPWPELTDCGKAYEYVRASQAQPVFAESSGPLLLAHKPVLVTDSFVYLQLSRYGLWPDQRLRDLIARRYFGLVVMSTNPQAQFSETWPQSMLNAIGENYHVVERFNCRSANYLLVPNAPVRSMGSGGSNYRFTGRDRNISNAPPGSHSPHS